MSLSTADYVLQATGAILVLVYPWLLGPRRGWQAFLVPFLFILAWGLWRMVYFDPGTKNDIPGIGYVAATFAYSFVARAFYSASQGIRRIVRNRKIAPEKAELRCVANDGVAPTHKGRYSAIR